MMRSSEYYSWRQFEKFGDAIRFRQPKCGSLLHGWPKKMVLVMHFAGFFKSGFSGCLACDVSSDGCRVVCICI